jgi:hypothetical protein
MIIQLWPCQYIRKQILLGETATRTVAHTLKDYSAHTFDYPYPKVSVSQPKIKGMEYPMICWNYGRPDENEC